MQALPLFAAFSFLLGIQFFISGILADIGVKNYFAVQDIDSYRVVTVLESEGYAAFPEGAPSETSNGSVSVDARGPS